MHNANYFANGFQSEFRPLKQPVLAAVKTIYLPIRYQRSTLWSIHAQVLKGPLLQWCWRINSWGLDPVKDYTCISRGSVRQLSCIHTSMWCKSVLKPWGKTQARTYKTEAELGRHVGAYVQSEFHSGSKNKPFLCLCLLSGCIWQVCSARTHPNRLYNSPVVKVLAQVGDPGPIPSAWGDSNFCLSGEYPLNHQARGFSSVPENSAPFV